MNIIIEYQKIAKELGEKKISALQKYVHEIPYSSVRRIYNDKKEFEKFELWYKNRKEPIEIKGIVLDFEIDGNVVIKTKEDTLTYRVEKFSKISDGKFYFVSDNTRYIVDNSEFLKDVK